MDYTTLDSHIAVYYKSSETYDDMSAHFHHLYEMILVDEGVAEFNINGKIYLLHQNEIIFISNLEKHSVRILEYPYNRTVITMTTNFTLFNIKEPLLVSLLSHRPPNFPYVFSLSPEVFSKVKRLANDLIDECELKDYFWLNRSASIISGMLIDIYRYDPVYFQSSEKTNVTSVILEIQKFISANFREEISLDVLSEKFFFSTFYISRKFKEITGYNIKNYIILNRMAIAKELLRLSSKSILEISVEVGYENVDQFTRIFKQYDGLSPSNYRAEYRHIDQQNMTNPPDWSDDTLNHYKNAH